MMTGVAALAGWILNTVVGLTMLWRWLARRRAGSAGLPSLVYVHLVTATAGLGLWITYLAAGRPAALAWVAFVLLNVNNGLGDTLLTRLWRARTGTRRSAPRDYLRAALEAMSGKRPAVMAHGLLAGAVYFLVLLAALGVAN